MESETEPLIPNGNSLLSSPKLPFRIRMGFGVGHVLNDLCSSMWFTYLLVFYNLVLGFDDWQAGFLLFVGQVADAVANPFVGYQTDQPDNLWICKYGKKKIWHLVGTVCVLISFPCIFLPCINTDSHRWAQLFYFSVFIIIFQFGWAAVQISHLSLIPELSHDEHHRTKLVATRYFFTVASNLFVYIIAWCCLGIANKDAERQIKPDDAPKFQIIVWASIIVGLFCTIIFHVCIKENYEMGNNNERKDGKKKLGILDVLRNLEYYKAAGVYMSTMLFINLSQVFIPLYLNETLNMSVSSLAFLPLVMYFGSLITTLTVERLNRCLSRKAVYIFGSLIGITGCLWIQLRSHSPQFVLYEIYAVSVLYGCASALVLVTNLAVTSDTIGGQNDNGAFIYGIMCFTDKLSNGTAVFLIQYLHKIYTDTMFYGNILTYVLGGALIIGTCSILSLKKTNDNKEEYISIT